MENWNCSGKKKWKSTVPTLVIVNLFCDIEKEVQSILSTWGPRTGLNWVKHNDDVHYVQAQKMHFTKHFLRTCSILNICLVFQLSWWHR